MMSGTVSRNWQAAVVRALVERFSTSLMDATLWQTVKHHSFEAFESGNAFWTHVENWVGHAPRAVRHGSTWLRECLASSVCRAASRFCLGSVCVCGCGAHVVLGSGREGMVAELNEGFSHSMLRCGTHAFNCRCCVGFPWHVAFAPRGLGLAGAKVVRCSAVVESAGICESIRWGAFTWCGAWSEVPLTLESMLLS